MKRSSQVVRVKRQEGLVFVFEHAVIDTRRAPAGREMALDPLPPGWVRVDCPYCHTLAVVNTEDQPPGDITCGYGRAIWSTRPTCPGR